MNKTAVAVSGKHEVAGPIMVAVVSVDSNFFRKHSFIKAKEPTMEESIKIFNRVNQKVNGNWVPISVKTINKSEDLDNTIIENMLQALNTIPRFWETEVSVLADPDTFVENYQNGLSHNLKNIMPDLKIEKWDVSEKFTRIKALAKAFANHGLNLQQNDIRETWGELDKLPNDCPHLRENGILEIQNKTKE